MDEEDNMLVLLENGEEEFWNRFYRERGDLRSFAMNQLDLLNAELRNQFLDRLNQANWNRRMDPGFEIARKMMHRVVWIYVSPPIVQSLDDLEKKVKRIKEKARKKEMKMNEAEKIARDAEKAIREAEKAEAQKKRAEWVKKQNEKFEAERIVHAADKAIREARNTAENARKKTATLLNKTNRLRPSSLGLH